MDLHEINTKLSALRAAVVRSEAQHKDVLKEIDAITTAVNALVRSAPKSAALPRPLPWKIWANAPNHKFRAYLSGDLCMISIGCHDATVDWWLGNVERMGRLHHYSTSDIEQYRLKIEEIAASQGWIIPAPIQRHRVVFKPQDSAQEVGLSDSIDRESAEKFLASLPESMRKFAQITAVTGIRDNNAPYKLPVCLDSAKPVSKALKDINAQPGDFFYAPATGGDPATFWQLCEYKDNDGGISVKELVKELVHTSTISDKPVRPSAESLAKSYLTSFSSFSGPRDRERYKLVFPG